MKTKNRILSILLAAIMILSIVPFSVFAEESEITEVGTWQELLNAVNSDKTYIKLMNPIEDIVPDDELPTKHRLVFDGGVDYVLDLNGYNLEVLNHVNEFYTSEFSMIEVSKSSKLEILDGSLVFDNYYAKSNRKAQGVVAVEDESTLIATHVDMRNKYTGTVVFASDDASVTLDGGEYIVQNGFALYLENRASLTLDGDIYIHTVMGDGAFTASVDGYGALYSESSGDLVIHNAFFKSGIQVSSSQISAFSIATHEITINGQVLNEEIFTGNSHEAKQQNKKYYWYSWTGCSLMQTENSSFTNPIRVISYEKKYPITVESGIAMVGGVPATEASYGQEVTVVAHTPEAGMEFVRWGTSGVTLANDYSASTTFTMVPAPVTLAAYYGKEAVKSVSVTVDDIVLGQKVTDTEITLENGVILQTVEWREESLLMGDYDVFKAGKTYTVKLLVYPPEEHKFDNTISVTVNGKNATASANPQYAYIDYTFEPTPSAGFAIVYDIDDSQLGIGGKIVLDTALMASQSAEFKTALDTGKVIYQWYRNGEAIEGANEAAYNFTAEDAANVFYVVVTANGKTNYGHNITCGNDVYQLYLNASGIVPGGKVPQITAATPGISIDVESMIISEILGNNSFGASKNVENSVLVPGKSYLLVGVIIEQDNVDLANGANVYVNGVLMKDTFAADTNTTGRFFYEFTVPEADYSVYYKANGEIGIGVTLTVDVERMCNESGTFKHAVEVQTANPTYKTVFYQWYKNGVAIGGATKDSYTVKSTDKNSLIHCQVTLVDGKIGIGEQCAISNVITVINVRISKPKDGETRITSGISADGVNVSNIMWIHKESGVTMQSSHTYVEGDIYEYLIVFEAKEGFLLNFTTGKQTVAYIYGAKATNAATGQGTLSYFGEVTASHNHQYSDDVWDHDEYGHWQPCIKPNCPDPTEEWEMYTEHTGGTATCQTKGECAICGAEYYADHDFSVPDYQYVDDMKCANFCEHCDVYVDWSYHEGGVSDCQHKAVCEFCHHEYGKLGEHTFGEWIEELPATIDATGTKGHKDCSICQKHFDADGKEIADLTIAKLENVNTNTNTSDNNGPTASDAPSDDKDGLSAGAIVGIVIGSVAVVGIGGFALVWFVIKKKSFADLIAVFKKK